MCERKKERNRDNGSGRHSLVQGILLKIILMFRLLNSKVRQQNQKCTRKTETKVIVINNLSTLLCSVLILRYRNTSSQASQVRGQLQLCVNISKHY